MYSLRLSVLIGEIKEQKQKKTYKTMNVDETSSSSSSSKYIKLVSMDKHEFFVERKIAMESSQTIRTMLEGSFRESQEGIISFPEIQGYILEKVLKYMYYKAQYSHSTTRIPEFVIEPEVALELVIASKYLDC